MAIAPQHALTLLFVRHGETDDNKRRIVQGTIDTPLNDLGRQQALECAVRLKDVNASVCYASDLARAYETAEFVLKEHHAKVELRTDVRLRERNMGIMQGHIWRDFDALSPEELATLEPKEALYARIRAFVADLCAKHIGHGDQEEKVDFESACDTEKNANGIVKLDSNIADSADRAHGPTILIVTHGGWIHAFTQLLLASDDFPDSATTDGGTMKLRGLDGCTSCSWPAGARELVQTRDYLVPDCSITELRLTSARAASDTTVANKFNNKSVEGDAPSVNLKLDVGTGTASFDIEVIRLSSLAAMPATLKGAATTVEDPMV